MRKVLLASTIALLGFASTAQAHFGLVLPPQVVSQADQNGKGSPPCGPDTGMAATPTPVMGGHPLTIKVVESVGHFGFYRVALALHSRSELPVDNKVYDSKNNVLPPSGMPSGMSDRADYENPAVFPVLADHLFNHDNSAPSGMPYMGDVMIPNVSCDRCILQVIEFMHPHGFNTSNPGPGGGYFYHHCAELKITPDPGMPLFVPPNGDGGVPDAASMDAKEDASSTGTGGTTGIGGANGSAGSAGGAGGTGAAGSSVTGAAGSSGAAGSTGTSGSNGAAGSSVAGMTGGAGTAGTSGAAGAKAHGGSGGGCSYSDKNVSGSVTPLLLGAVLASSLLVRGRRKRR